MSKLTDFIKLMTGHFDNKEQFDKMQAEGKTYPYAKHINTAVSYTHLSDIQGGINAGIQTIWFHRLQDLTEDPQPKSDYEINSLKFLLEMLK